MNRKKISLYFSSEKIRKTRGHALDLSGLWISLVKANVLVLHHFQYSNIGFSNIHFYIWHNVKLEQKTVLSTPTIIMGENKTLNNSLSNIKRLHLSKRPPKNNKSLNRLLRKARLALFLAKLRPLNQEISKKEKTPIISQPVKNIYQERP